MHQNSFSAEAPPGPRWEAYDALQTSYRLVSHLAHPRRFRRLDLGAYSASVVRPQHKFLATPIIVVRGKVPAAVAFCAFCTSNYEE